MDEMTAWEMVEALADIAEVLGLQNVGSAQIVEAVKAMKQDLNGANMALSIVQAQVISLEATIDEIERND
jgi:hypothetical protein